MNQQKIACLEEKISQLPGNELHCIKNGSYIKWFQDDGDKQWYIPKKEHHIAETLASKKLYNAQLQDLKEEQQMIEDFLQEEALRTSKEKQLLQSENYQELLKIHFNSHPDFIKQWVESDFIKNPVHSETLIHKTLSGQLVRSKSEVIIANKLFLNKIPFLYERGLSLDDNLFFPDFTICHPKSYKIFYWEHFGMMDKQLYSDHAYNKLKIYSSHGIIPTINLITTYETKEHPLDSTQIDRMIFEYFQI